MAASWGSVSRAALGRLCSRVVVGRDRDGELHARNVKREWWCCCCQQTAMDAHLVQSSLSKHVCLSRRKTDDTQFPTQGVEAPSIYLDPLFSNPQPPPPSPMAMLTTLRRAAIVLPLAWTGAWLGYYGESHCARCLFACAPYKQRPSRHPSKV